MGSTTSGKCWRLQLHSYVGWIEIVVSVSFTYRDRYRFDSPPVCLPRASTRHAVWLPLGLTYSAVPGIVILIQTAADPEGRRTGCPLTWV